MARIKGQANYASNFEVLKQAPLDSRSVVSESDDLIKKVTWQDADGNIWLYNGLMVVVPNTDTEKVPEVYILKKKEDYDKPETWVKLGADNALAIKALQGAVKAIQTTLTSKANLVEGKVATDELPIVSDSLVQSNDKTIPSAKLVNSCLTSLGENLEQQIKDKVVGLLNWQGVKDTEAAIKAIASAKKGDVYHANDKGSEWVCTKDISAADASVWTELGTPVVLSGYYTKTEVDKKVKSLSDSIGTDSDVASANGSVYARIKKNADDIAKKASTTELEGVKDKISTLNDKVDKNAEAIGTTTDSASANGSLYARVKKNADDIATKASNDDLAALQSKVDNKANKTALETLQASVGNTSDAADASGSVYARIAQNKANIPTAVQLVVRTI